MDCDTPIQRPDGCEDGQRGFNDVAENRCDIQELGVTRHFQPILQHSTKLAEEVTLPAVRLDRNLNKMRGVWN